MRSKDVGFLIEHLHWHAYKWREIGTALGFQHGELENIRQSFPRATMQQLLRELIYQWSQWPTVTHSEVPTMEKLYDAMRSGSVGLGAVANELYSKRTLLPSW